MVENYKSQSDYFDNLLKKSRTAFSPGSKPTYSDISLQRQYQNSKNEEEAESQTRLKEQWYSEKKASGEGDPSSLGLLGSSLKLLATPGYMVTGALEAGLGKGRQTGVIENMWDNVDEQGTAGDLLRSYGLNNYVAAPLGFALDIALDPLSWVTGGGNTLAGKIGMGAIKSSKAGTGVLAGAKLGAEAGLLGKAAWTGNKLMKAGEKFKVVKPLSEDAEAVSRARTTMNSLNDRYLSKTNEFNELTGNSVQGLIANQGFTRNLINNARIKVSDRLDQTPWGQKVSSALSKGFDYDSSKHFRASKLAEDVARETKTTDEDLLKGIMGKNFQDTGDVLYHKIQPASVRDSLVLQQELQDQSRKSILMSKRINEEFDKVRDLFVNDLPAMNKLDSLAQDKKKLNKYMDGFSYFKTNMESWNKGVAKVYLNPAGREFFNGMAVLHGLFKNMKTGMNVFGSAGVNGFFGNISFVGAAGVNPVSKGMMTSVRSAYGMVQKKDLKKFTSLLSDADFNHILNNNPKLFESTYGIRADVLTKGWSEIQETTARLIRENPTYAKELNGVSVKKFFDEAAAKTAIDHRIIGNINSAGKVSRTGENASTFLSGEIMTGPYTKFVEKLEGKGGALGVLAKALKTSTETYGKVDQVARMSLTLNLTQEGITKLEFQRLLRRFPMGASDVVEKGGKVFLKPLKAMEVSQEVFLNYSAMPGFVQIMRTLPLVGSPFLSFSYGAANHAAKTLLYNPEFYNKVQYALHEISGQKSPLEKEALDSEYYSWMKQPGVMKVPFFQENPVYLNVSNMIPYYTMSLLQTNQRDYESKYGKEVSALIDKSPFFKTPEGQVLLDNIILPTLIANERPLGAFGQPLWEKDASNTAKVGYAARSLAEALTPPPLGYVGGIASMVGVPESTIPYMPSYSYRKSANAFFKQGVTGLGGKEDAFRRTVRAGLSSAGIPLHPITLQYAEQETE